MMFFDVLNKKIGRAGGWGGRGWSRVGVAKLQVGGAESRVGGAESRVGGAESRVGGAKMHVGRTDAVFFKTYTHLFYFLVNIIWMG